MNLILIKICVYSKIYLNLIIAEFIIKYFNWYIYLIFFLLMDIYKQINQNKQHLIFNFLNLKNIYNFLIIVIFLKIFSDFC